MSEDTKKQHKLIRELYKCHSTLIEAEKALVLFDSTTQFIAIGNSADELYLKFGWELSMIDIDDNSISYMFLIVDAVKLLNTSEYKIITIDFKCEEMFSTIAVVQQSLDYLRNLQGNKELDYPIIECNVDFEDSAYIRFMRITSVIISQNFILVHIDRQETIYLAWDHSWNFSPQGIIILQAIKNVLMCQYELMKEIAIRPKATIKALQIDCTKIYETYLSRKEKYPTSDIICVKVKEGYLTFDDDVVIIISSQANIIYDINSIGVRGKHCVLLTSAQISKLVLKRYKIELVPCEQEYTIYQLGLKESLLNVTCNGYYHYTDAVIHKDYQGKYIVTAYYKGNKLPEKIISNAIGGYYSRLPQCLEKDFTLYFVVHYKYDKIISQDYANFI